jgi:hypothetical protein
MTSVFKAVKALMEEQQSIKFTIDEDNETFTCDQFDAEGIVGKTVAPCLVNTTGTSTSRKTPRSRKRRSPNW